MAQPQPPGARFHPAKEVDIPKNQVTNLENKLNSTINEIDRLNEDIARGELTATMLSWWVCTAPLLTAGTSSHRDIPLF